MSASAETQPDLTSVAALTPVQKFAMLLIILGPDSASQMLRQLSDSELESVTGEMSKITVVTQEMRQEILREFTTVAVEAGSSTLGGLDFTRNALERSVGQFRAATLISRVAPARANLGGMQQIGEMEARQIINLLKHEQPQTIALITSYLPPEKGSEVLGLLRAEVRDQVVERIATMAPTPIEVVERVIALINQRLSSRPTRALNQTGGVKIAAELLNSVEKDVTKTLLVNLEERNPELVAAIRQKMFTFEDLAGLDPTALQRILREVEMRDLAMALKTASDRVKQALLACISKRAAETVNEEISFMGPLRLRDIESAQARIIEAVRRLEAEGEIELGSADGTDEVVA